MLFDLIQSYTEEKKAHLCDLWTKIIEDLSRTNDQKKIISFLNKAGIIGIDEKEKKVHIGVPNEFVLLQAKKFFNTSLKKTIHTIYNPHFGIEFHVYTPFQKKANELQINTEKLLNIQLPKQEAKALINNNSQSAAIAQQFGSKLSANYTFQTFVSGGHNNFALGAAKAVAEAPGMVYNPLFIYGNVGLGKTHLMQAIAHHILANNPDKTVLYLPTTKLIDEIVDAIRKNKLTNLMRKFDDVDVLLIDDIQFLADKDKTQEIFHNIFNDFHMNNKQVVLTSDRAPKDLNNIEARLKSRFALGLVADIQKPDYETRIAILQSKLAQKAQTLSFDLLAILAKNIQNNVRELEGALNILVTRKNISGNDLSENDMYECLRTLGYESEQDKENTRQELSQINTKSIMSYSKIVEFVSTYYNVSVDELKSPIRKKEITQARQTLMVIAKNHFSWTLERIGDYFGGKNHATVIYALNNFKKKIKVDKTLLHDYNIFMEQLEK